MRVNYPPDYPVKVDTAGNSTWLGYHPALNNQSVVQTRVTSCVVQRTYHSSTEPSGLNLASVLFYYPPFSRRLIACLSKEGFFFLYIHVLISNTMLCSERHCSNHNTL